MPAGKPGRLASAAAAGADVAAGVAASIPFPSPGGVVLPLGGRAAAAAAVEAAAMPGAPGAEVLKGGAGAPGSTGTMGRAAATPLGWAGKAVTGAGGVGTAPTKAALGVPPCCKALMGRLASPPGCLCCRYTYRSTSVAAGNFARLMRGRIENLYRRKLALSPKAVESN